MRGCRTHEESLETKETKKPTKKEIIEEIKLIKVTVRRIILPRALN